MTSSVLLCGAIVLGALAADDPATKGSDQGAYKSAAATAGHDAAAHVRLALWCEAHGLTSERLEHLTQAVKYQPSNALARGLLGLVLHQGQWDQVEAVREKVENDPAQQALIKAYLERRAATPDTSEAQMKLAAWCEGKRLKEQAVAHYNAAIRLDPSRATAWRHLGYKKRGHRWVNPEQVAAEKQDALRQKQADKRWRPKLAKLRGDLQSNDAAKRARAEEALDQVTDPRAVPSIWSVFMTRSVPSQMIAIQLFGQIEGPSASSALAALALHSPRTEVREAAIEALKQRDPRDVMGRLIGMVHKPLKYQVRPGQAPGSPGELFVEDERFNLQRFYQNQTSTPLLSAGLGRLFTPDVPFDPFSVRNMLLAIPAWTGGPSGMNMMTPNTPYYTRSFSAPLSPDSVTQAMRAAEANPNNSHAILNQLVSDPNNRVVPPGFWFFDPTDTIPGHLVRGGGPLGLAPSPAAKAGMDAFARQVQSQQGNPNSPMGKAITVGRMESSPASMKYGPGLGMMLEAQQMAIQRDMQIGYELEMIRQSNQNLQQRLAMDVEFIEWTNKGIKQGNARALPVLKAIAGVDLGPNQEKWKKWWMAQLDYADRSSQSKAKPSYQESVTGSAGIGTMISPRTDQAATNTDAVTGAVPTMPVRACFGAGTAVHTIGGPRPIESIDVGDEVLCQDTATGALEFQPVLATHRGRPLPTLRIAVGGQWIVATGIQRFWRAGTGWTMARALKVGDRVRITGGVAKVAAVAADKSQPVYNVEVADNGDLFVGTKGFLVHDFGLVRAIPEPFDRQLDLLSPSASAKP